MKEVEYTPSIHFKWKENGQNQQVEEECKHFIFGYQLNEIPKFDGLKNEKGLIEALLRQKILIDGVNNVSFLKKGISAILELRLRNNIQNLQIECYLLIRVILTSKYNFLSPSTLKKYFDRLIPEEYSESRELSSDEIKTLLKFQKDTSLVEIRKKTHFIPVGNFSYEGQIQIASKNLDVKALDKGGRFYVPLSSYLEPKTYNLSSFYSALQSSKEPVQIRISISLMDTFESERNLALQYHKLITHSYNSINISEVSNNLQSFSKYINNSILSSIKIQVASEYEATSYSIANMFCGQLSYGEIKSKTHLECVSLVNYDFEIKEKDWGHCNHYHYPVSSHLGYFGDNLDSITLSFINRMIYLTDNTEVMSVFRLPIATEKGLPGIVTKSPKPFYQPNPKNEHETAVLHLGKIMSSSNSLDYTLPIKDLTKHGLIVGATGSGKTNTTLNFIKELIKRGIPFLLIEPVKSEYYDKLKPLFEEGKLNRFNFKSPFTEEGDCNSEFLRFNPFIPMEGISVIQHISYVKSCFMAAFPMYGIMPLVFEDCLYQLYLDYYEGDEFKMFDAKYSPKYKHDFTNEAMELNDDVFNEINYFNIESFISTINKVLSNKKLYTKDDKKEIGAVLSRRIKKLTKGIIGNSFFNHNWRNLDEVDIPIQDNITKILTEPTILELEHLTDNDDKALIMAFILTLLFEYKQTKPTIYEATADNTHVTIIEEAHRLLSSGSLTATGKGEDGVMTQDGKSKSISLFIDMIAEIRAKGEAIFIVEQIPTKLISEVIKNTNLKIMHRITSKDDRQYLGEAMNMNEEQKDYVTNLKSGEAIIFDEQLDNPVFVKINKFKNKENEE